MDARILRTGLILASIFLFTGADFPTRNFIVTAPTREIAQQVGKAAEAYRRDLAIFWLGQPLPNWSRPCKLRVRPGSLGAGGETKFQFVGGEVINWNMYVQGSLERILDSVLPHEVNHTIFASHFRRPLPRWADEGAATLFEHRSEQVKQLGLLNQIINSERELISLRRLLTMKEYPRGYRPMLILYAEGYALADFLVQQGGQRKYLKFLTDGERIGWTNAIRSNYHHGGVDALQKNWKGWVMAGMPKLTDPREEMLAASDVSNRIVQAQGVARPAILNQLPVKRTVRSQSPDSATTTEKQSSVKERAPAREDMRSRNSTLKSNARQVSSRDPDLVPLPRRRVRSASFEAPLPQNSLSPPTGSPQIKEESAKQKIDPASNNSLPGLRLSDSSLEFTDPDFTTTGLFEYGDTQNQRKHLPQERKVVTGSIPQWAGFPGQTELF